MYLNGIQSRSVRVSLHGIPHFPDGIPAEETSADAIAPFAEDQAVIDLFGAEYRAREYEL